MELSLKTLGTLALGLCLLSWSADAACPSLSQNACNSGSAYEFQNTGTTSPQQSLVGYCSGYASCTGVLGESTDAVGVIGENTNCNADAIQGNSCSAYSSGIYAYNTGGGYGIYAQQTQATGYAGYFAGPVDVTGTLTKPAGSFKIDHPLDPANKYLYHSFVESPDMKNVYDGVATLDSSGTATVELPKYFQALNKDYRYQLTSIGHFAPIYVAQEVSENSFKIAGGLPGQRVSWQVTGIRQDPYAAAHAIVPEVDKALVDRGKYLYSMEVAGLPRSSATTIGWRDPPPTVHAPVETVPETSAPTCH